MMVRIAVPRTPPPNRYFPPNRVARMPGKIGKRHNTKSDFPDHGKKPIRVIFQTMGRNQLERKVFRIPEV